MGCETPGQGAVALHGVHSVHSGTGTAAQSGRGAPSLEVFEARLEAA